jgi:glutamine amidotransferase
MIAIIDYGVGNLYSLSSSLKHLNIETVVTNRKEDLIQADRIILPGVGAFEDAMKKLSDSGMVEPLLEQVAAGKPLLGICLGMQLLFRESHEYGIHKGLGLVDGVVASLADDLKALGGQGAGLKVPHIGWNRLDIRPGHEADPIFQEFRPGSHVYYVHSFYAKECEESILATSEYGLPVPGIVRKGNVIGMQFHPEKSGQVGLSLLSQFNQL